MMKKEDQRVLEQFAARVRALFPDVRLWAFGSRARGEAQWESDLDVCIVLEKVDQHTDRLIRDIAWDVGFENDRVITTVVMEREEFERGPMSASTLVANILQEGVRA